MRIVIQRVLDAEVREFETNELVGKIDNGLFILIGISKDDTAEDSGNLAEKVAKLRIMADKNGKMNLSSLDAGSKVLVVSQFTLLANTKDGNRPSFVEAAEPLLAKKLYEHFIEKLRSLGLTVETGKFGAYMRISANLDGPVTILLN